MLKKAVPKPPRLRPNAPGDRIRVQQVGEELPDVPQLIRLQPVHRVVLHPEALREVVLVHGVQAAEPLRLEHEEPVEHLLHGTTVDEHGADLLLLALRDVELQDLVHALLIMHRGHDHQVDLPPQVHHVLLREVQYLLLRPAIRRRVRLLVRVLAAVAAGLILLQAQDLAGDQLPLGLVGGVGLGGDGLKQRL